MAYERCPAYWASLDRQLDPHDHTKLMEITTQKNRKTRGVKA
jgi:hypothetical protein